VTIDYTLTLDYKLQAGWLVPFIQGLQCGIARARRCDACKHTSFPPLRVCQCNHTNGTWVNLQGEANIVHRCDGLEGSFALVQFIGADTQTVVKLEGMKDTDQTGYLQSCETMHGTPALVLCPHQLSTDSGRAP